MDCAVEVDGSVVSVIIGARVGECTARFWSGRSLSNYHMAIHTYIHKSFIEKMTERISLTIREKHR